MVIEFLASASASAAKAAIPAVAGAASSAISGAAKAAVGAAAKAVVGGVGKAVISGVTSKVQTSFIRFNDLILMNISFNLYFQMIFIGNAV